MKLLLTIALSTLLTATACSQVVVKHFNASWNKDHKVTWLTNLSDCSVKYYDGDRCKARGFARVY